MVRHALLFTLLALWWSSAAASEFTASVDRTQVGRDGYILLTLKLANSDTRLRARGVSPNVDLTLLSDDFEVGVPHTRNRFNLYRGHGRSTSELEVELFPKRRGTLTIPSFSIDGHRTKPISVLVVAAGKNPTPDVFVRTGVTRRTVWLRQQTEVYLDLYYRVDLKDARLGEHLDTDPLDIDLDKLPDGKRKESIGPFTYHVQRIGWALMPLHSGKLVVTLPELWAQTTEGKKFHHAPQKQVITVKALPPSVPPLTIVGKPRLTVNPPPTTATVNELTSWTVTLRAPTALDALPRTLPMNDLPKPFKFYFDRPDLHKDLRSSGMVAVAAYAVSAIPLKPGSFRMPAIEIPYFDPAEGRMSSVKQAAVSLTVAAAAHPGAAATAAPADAPRASGAPPPRRGSTPYWQAATGLFAALWLGTGTLWWRRRPAAGRRRPPDTVPAAPPSPDRPLQTRLLAAFGSRTLEEGLNDFERRHGVHDEVRATVRAVQRAYYGRGKGPADPALEQAVAKAVAAIRETTARDAGGTDRDPWSPRAFTTGRDMTKRPAGS